MLVRICTAKSLQCFTNKFILFHTFPNMKENENKKRYFPMDYNLKV